MRTMRIVGCAAAAVCLAATVPARAEETWDETLKNTISTWWNAAGPCEPSGHIWCII
jgi:hypothetical protein